MDTTYAWAPITKAEKRPDGTLMVYGPATDAGLDRDKQRMNQEWLDQAMPVWKAEGGNIREQHDSKRAVGVAAGLAKDPATGAHLLAAHVVDPVAVLKVENKVLTGFSIGVKDPIVAMGKADAPNGEVVGGKIIEVSLVDRPANPRTTFTMVKADGGDLEPVENPTIVESPDAGDSEGEPDEPVEADEAKVDEPDLVKMDVPAELAEQVQALIEKRDFTADERKKDAKSGAAMGDGSFPIHNAEDLDNAVHLVGHAHDPAAARRHIISRARALGLVAQLPDDWGVSKAEDLVEELSAYAPDLAKYDEAADIAGADQAMALIARLIASEAAELANGRQEEARDISILLDAHRALSYFKDREMQQQNTTPPADAEMADLLRTETTPDDGGSTTSTIDVPELVKAAVAEATKAQEERYEELLKKFDAFEELVAAMPQPGGPVLTRTREQDQKARQHDATQLRAQANDLLAKAEAVGNSDPTLAAGWRTRAAELLAKADA